MTTASNGAVRQLLSEQLQIIGDDSGMFMLRQAMAREDFSDDVFIVADAIAVPVAGQALQAVAPFEGNEEEHLPRRA